jgi:phage head maturation protease
LTTYAIEGICTALKTCFQHRDRILYFETDAFNESRDVKLLYDHDKEVFKTRTVEIYAGKSGLAFRMVLPSRKMIHSQP